MSTLLQCAAGEQWSPILRQARNAVQSGELVVLPTDTVYGIGADAFSAEAVARLLAAKGRTRQSPPPVLITDEAAAKALTDHRSEVFDALAEKYWPGALTMIVSAQPQLQWDLGETKGTVGLRIPNHEFTRELLADVGPMAVSSANLTGEPAATTIAAAQQMLGDSVSVYLDAGKCDKQSPSTIVDLTDLNSEMPVVRIVRLGDIDIADIISVVQALSPGVEVSYVPAPPAQRAATPSDSADAPQHTDSAPESNS